MSGAPGGSAELADRESLPAAGLRRRLASFCYEGVLLFGVLMTAGLIYAALTRQDPALLGRHGLQAFLFAVLGLYFGWLWSHGGQTVAMKAWRIRLLRTDGRPVSLQHALLRYLLSWLWFAPALLALGLLAAPSLGSIAVALGSGVTGYAALAWLHPDRQFCHDALCRTRLVDWRAGGPTAH